ncbi:hypothetical protein PVK06_026471 [Gossypium arboreum]|uniref:Reverse transcriptase zinc-binding domain-containing protein n=1 Tax=Gossypium arboreum TaxID=29729 RepID=A0ABR0P0M2_GOSAR|nr:hypothetical protein PVK06_026471 [Gossypium arboreum]
MQYRKLAINTSCPRCGERAETMDHLFRECPVTVETWKSLSLRHIVMIKNMDFEQWLTWVLWLEMRMGQFFYHIQKSTKVSSLHLLLKPQPVRKRYKLESKRDGSQSFSKETLS